MDGKRFDALAKLSVTRGGRQRLLQTALAAGFGGPLGRGAVETQAAGIEACQNLQSSCDRNRQCECKDRRNVICDPLRSQCNKPGDRCCGTARARCNEDCDCGKGYRCNENKKKCVNN
jgi:hypothetical protein